MFDSPLFWIAVIVVVAVLAYRFSPGFKERADKHIDKDGDGRPFR